MNADALPEGRLGKVYQANRASAGKALKHLTSRSAVRVHWCGTQGEQSQERPQGAKPWDEGRVQGLPEMGPAQL